MMNFDEGDELRSLFSYDRPSPRCFGEQGNRGKISYIREHHHHDLISEFLRRSFTREVVLDSHRRQKIFSLPRVAP